MFCDGTDCGSLFHSVFHSYVKQSGGVPEYLLPGKIIKCIMCVCAIVCHADFSKTTTATEFLSIICPNELSRP